VPVFIFKYLFQGQTYTAVVDASSATVLANIYPAKSELPYRTVGGVAAVVFLCLALMPVMGAIVNEESGLMVGLLICGGLGLIAAPILIAWAAWVAGKV